MLFNFLVGFFTSIITTLGYPGIVLLMAMESMIFPVPSELVMPFAGYAVASGHMHFWWALAAASVGTLIGSALSYMIGQALGRPFLERYGKYFLVNKHHLELTDNWFKKRGELTIFISRFIPVVRHLISIPAGMARMHKGRFLLYTFLGGTMWNGFLLYVGILLKENWERISVYTSALDVLVLLLVVVGIVYFVLHVRKQRT